jgi:flagellar biosynthesis/type III secretory pathway M-ring protein FliF/YscJ
MKLNHKILSLGLTLSCIAPSVTVFAEGKANEKVANPIWSYLLLVILVMILIFQLVYPIKKYDRERNRKSIREV